MTYGYQYDRYGNRWHQNVTAGTGNQVDMPTDNTTNKISTTGISQDALGNITNDGSHTYTFDAENRITQVDGGSTATYVYDALNRRVKKTVGATAREFLFDAAGRPFVEVGNSGTSWVRTEIFIGGTHLATYSNGHTYFHNQNWLGSRATTTDETGAKVQDCEWYPFGDLKACTTNTNLYAYTPYGYADYERDSETGLDHMQFRYFNSRIGRFMGADLLSGTAGYPQSLNKFGYVLNQPNNFIDPSGLACSGDRPTGGDTACNPANSSGGGGSGFGRNDSFSFINHGPGNGPGYWAPYSRVSWNVCYEDGCMGGTFAPRFAWIPLTTFLNYSADFQSTLLRLSQNNEISLLRLRRALDRSREAREDTLPTCTWVFLEQASQIASEALDGVPGMPGPPGEASSSLDRALEVGRTVWENGGKELGTVFAIGFAQTAPAEALAIQAGGARVLATGGRFAPHVALAGAIALEAAAIKREMEVFQSGGCDARLARSGN